MIIEEAVLDAELKPKTVEDCSLDSYPDFAYKCRPPTGSCVNLLLVSRFVRRRTMQAVSRLQLPVILEYGLKQDWVTWTHLPCRLPTLGTLILIEKPPRDYPEEELKKPTTSRLSYEILRFFKVAFKVLYKSSPACCVERIVLRSAFNGDVSRLSKLDTGVLKAEVQRCKKFMRAYFRNIERKKIGRGQ
jgi:hypothetical protein